MRIQPMLAAALLAVIAIPAGAQQRAPQGERITGTVTSVTTSQLTLATANGDINIALTPHTRVFVREPASISDIKPGAYLGTANQNNTSGSNAGTAKEIHLARNGPNVDFPMNKSGLMMTNGHVKSVTSTSDGLEMDINYGKNTTRHVLVKKNTPITRMKDMGVTGLRPGLKVTAMTTRGSDKRLTATFILIEPASSASQG